MMSVPGRAPATTPSGPKSTASTSGVSDTQMTDDVGVGDGLGRRRGHRDPGSASSAARPGVRFQPVTAKPARARLAAIAAPIVPRPRKATRVASSG